jgi:hypothetical protein
MGKDVFWMVPDDYEEGVVIVVFHKHVTEQEAAGCLMANGIAPGKYFFIWTRPQIWAKIIVTVGKEFEVAAKLQSAMLVETAALSAKPKNDMP